MVALSRMSFSMQYNECLGTNQHCQIDWNQLKINWIKNYGTLHRLKYFIENPKKFQNITRNEKEPEPEPGKRKLQCETKNRSLIHKRTQRRHEDTWNLQDNSFANILSKDDTH